MIIPKEQLIEAISDCNGIHTVIARKLGITQQAVSKRINAHDDLKEACQAAKDRLLDDAENQLAIAVRKGSPWAVRFILATLGKSLGYTKTVQIEGSMEQSGKIILSLPDDGREMTGPSGDATMPRLSRSPA